MSRKYLLFYRVRRKGVQAVLNCGRVRAGRHSHFPQVQDVPPRQHFDPNQSVQGTDSPIWKPPILIALGTKRIIFVSRP